VQRGAQHAHRVQRVNPGLEAGRGHSNFYTLWSVSTVPPHGQPRASFTKEAFDGAAEL
jgi:hypothetical protein